MASGFFDIDAAKARAAQAAESRDRDVEAAQNELIALIDQRIEAKLVVRGQVKHVPDIRDEVAKEDGRQALSLSKIGVALNLCLIKQVLGKLRISRPGGDDVR